MQPENPHIVFCLCIDLIGSTEVGLGRTEQENKEFNMALVRQINPHLESLDLKDALVKFTGDGWLLMTSDASQLSSLCCLALIQAKGFQSEMGRLTNANPQMVPPPRIAICFGEDYSVTLPDGRSDWVGDSARRANRAARYCKSLKTQTLTNEILVDDTVRSLRLRNFNFTDANMNERHPVDEENEEKLTLWLLTSLKPETCSKSPAPHHFVYTLGVIATAKEAQEVLQEVIDKDAAAVVARSKGKPRIIPGWDKLISSLPDYVSAIKMVERIRDKGLRPTVATYSILIKKAPDLLTGQRLLNAMRKEGLAPNVITYNTLIDKAKFEDGEKLLDEMRKEKLAPDVITYNTLIDKAKFEDGKKLLDEMHEKGLTPNVITYSTLIGKVEFEDGKKLLDEMRKEKLAPNVITYNTLIDKAEFEDGKKLLDEMRKEKLAPNVVTYSTLIDKASYADGRELLKAMHKEGVAPNEFSYGNLFKKDITESADELLKWYLAEPNHPESAVRVAITSYLRRGETQQAMRLTLGYAHLPEARKLMREKAEECLSYFKSFLKADLRHPNADYAIGRVYMEQRKFKDAQPYLEKALKLATAESRKNAINDWLREIQASK